MNLRPIAAVATALACAFATPSTAGGNVALDGVRRTHASFQAEVTDPAFTAGEGGIPADPEPSMQDCSSTSCDITALRLTLPKDSSAGRFKVTVTMPRELNGAVALYNVEGERVAKADLLANNESICCDLDETWKVSFVVARLTPGTYTFVVYNRGGSGTFTADIDYKANRPDRRRS